MPDSGHSRWRGFAVLTLLATLLTPVAAGTAQSATGDIRGAMYDDANWIQVAPVCATATSQADGVSYSFHGYSIFVIEDVPYGLYDVVITDCGAGLHLSTTVTDVEVGPPPFPDYRHYSTPILTTFSPMVGAALITGQVVENYSGYPLQRKRVVTVDPVTGINISETCTDNEGWYSIEAAPDVPVFVKFDDGCSGGGTHQTQWYPYSRSIKDAEALVPHTGSYVFAHGAMSFKGGFVGTVYDPTREVPGYGWRALVKDGPYLGGGFVRQDGSFAAGGRYGTGILVAFQPRSGWDGYERMYLVDPSNPSVPASWNVGKDDHYDLGLILLDRPPALAGRVLDSDGHPVEGAAVSFIPAGEHGTVSSIFATTDPQGWYVTNGTARGDYTAVVTVPTATHDPWFEYNGTWLGNTPQRSEGDIIHLTGRNQGGIDFVVERGKASGIDVTLYSWDGPERLTTDREYDGATWDDPLEVTTVVTNWAPTSVGTFYEPNDRPGFTSFPFGAIVIYDAAPGSPAQEVDFTLEPAYLAGPIGEMQVVWNDRRLGSCTLVGPPCLDGITIDERGDVVVTARVTDGGQASFLWGATFLDIGGSVFLGDIEWLAAAGITTGCTPPVNDLYCPTREVTRGQMAAFLTRFLGLTDRGGKDFTDDNDSIFEADIEKLATAGITYGCNPPANDHFCPDDPVTREQMAAFLVRALHLTSRAGAAFTDDDDSVFEADIEKLATAGITYGCNPPTNDQFCPLSTVTREQMAAFLHRADRLATPASPPAQPPSPPAAEPRYVLPEAWRS